VGDHFLTEAIGLIEGRLLAIRAGRRMVLQEANVEWLLEMRLWKENFSETLLARKQELTSKSTTIFPSKLPLKMVKYRGQFKNSRNWTNFYLRLSDIIWSYQDIQLPLLSRNMPFQSRLGDVI